ncbi:SNF2 family N-terminal domain-containing protein, partial [Mycena maculata]
MAVLAALAAIFAVLFGWEPPASPKPTPFISAIEAAGIPPFWKSETAPEEHQQEWQSHWRAIRRVWKKTANTKETSRRRPLAEFDWAALPALQAVYDASHRYKWHTCLDPLLWKVERELQVRNMTPLGLLQVLDEPPRDGLPASDSWLELKRPVFERVFGFEGVAYPGVLLSFWQLWLRRRLDRDRRIRARRIKQETALRPDVTRLLTIGSVDDDGVQALRVLREYRSTLAWMPLSLADRRALSARSPDEDLSPNAKAFALCARALGHLNRLVTAEAFEVPELPPHLRPSYTLGFALPVDTPSGGDAGATEIAIELFVAEWMGASAAPGLDTILDGLDGVIECEDAEWRHNGDDMGTERLKGLSREELQAMLPSGGHPLAIRRFVARDPKRYIPGQDRALPGVTERLLIGDHQLQGVANIFDRLKAPTRPQREAPPNVPIAIREGFGAEPGTLLCDEPGLGKTLQAMLMIGCYIDLAETDSGPASLAWIRELFAAPHLIVVPPSLMYQWHSELQRFFRDDAVSITRLGTVEADWAKELASADASEQPPFRRIILASITTVTRMAPAALDVSERPTVMGGVSRGSLFARTWASLVVDEAHLLRTANNQCRAVDGLATLALIKLFITGTPYVEAPNDLLILSQLVRAPALDLHQWAQLVDALAKLARQKNAARQQDDEALLRFMASSTTRDAETSESPMAVIQRQGAQLVSTLRNILAPLCIRRTEKSVDCEGLPITRAVPPLTVVYLCYIVTADEKDETALFEEVPEPEDPMTTKLERVGASIHGASI